MNDHFLDSTLRSMLPILGFYSINSTGQDFFKLREKQNDVMSNFPKVFKVIFGVEPFNEELIRS